MFDNRHALKVLITFLILISAQNSFGGQNYNRDINDRNDNGIRDDIDRAIAEFPVEQKSKERLSHFAYFTNEFMREADDYQLAQIFFQKYHSYSCLRKRADDARRLSEVLARTLDSEEAVLSYSRAETRIGRMFWVQVVTKAVNCDHTLPNAVGQPEKWLSEAVKLDICQVAETGLVDPDEPVAQLNLQKCKDIRASHLK